jgi:hypothetical protein
MVDGHSSGKFSEEPDLGVGRSFDKPRFRSLSLRVMFQFGQVAGPVALIDAPSMNSV